MEDLVTFSPFSFLYNDSFYTILIEAMNKLTVNRDMLFPFLAPHCLWSNSKKCLERFTEITWRRKS